MKKFLSVLFVVSMAACGVPETSEELATEAASVEQQVSAEPAGEGAAAGTCKVCSGGHLAGYACIFHSDCGSTCAGGLMSGHGCIYNSDCPGSYCRYHTCNTISC